MQIARVYNDAMNIIHYMHDKYYYEKAQKMCIRDRDGTAWQVLYPTDYGIRL